MSKTRARLDAMDPFIEMGRVAELLDALTLAITRLRDEMATLRQTHADPWISQRTTPLAPRVHCRIARDGIAAGDQRCAHRGRIYYLRASRIDEEMRGHPFPASIGAMGDRPLTSAEKLRARLDAQRAARNGSAREPDDALTQAAAIQRMHDRLERHIAARKVKPRKG